MKDFLILLKAEITRDYIFIKRYPLEIIGSICVFYLVFFTVFFSSKFVYGTIGQKPMFLGAPIERWVIGSVLWIFGTCSTIYIAEQWNKEALVGTLEHLYISPSSIYILLARAFSILLYISLALPIALYLSQVSTGIYLNIKFFSILPILILTFIGLCGFGFLLAGITLIFKRIGPLFLILPFFPFGLSLFPIENLSTLASILPLACGMKLIMVMVFQNTNLFTLFINGDMLILTLNSTFYLLTGIFGYKILERIAKKGGLLGHY